MITKQTSDYSALDFLAGEIILLNKPSGWSSFRVVAKVRKSVNVKKVGHAGTLDPMATGLLIIATGKKTKELSSYQAMKKTYEGIITLGKSSPSMDLETEITLCEIPSDLSKEKIFETRDKFIGNIFQTPPIYSAIKVNGKRLYKLARKGKTSKIEPRKVTIYKFEIVKIELPDIYFIIECSKGTYIRSVASDFGKALNSGALLSSLKRTAIGDFDISNALEIEEFEKNINALHKP